MPPLSFLSQGAELIEEELRSWIKQEMPKYMHSNNIRFVDTLASNPNLRGCEIRAQSMNNGKTGIELVIRIVEMKCADLNKIRTFLPTFLFGLNRDFIALLNERLKVC